MTTKFQTPRGTRDFMPEDMVRRQYVFDTVRKVFERFGFRPLETPAFESWELLGAKGGGGEAIKNEIYLFKDKGGREMGLRFDLTVPTARVIASNPQLAKPFKRYQMGPVWRYDNPQAGRFREFWQCDADIFGCSSMAAEAEFIAVFVECLKELGFSGFEVKLNNRKLLNGMLEVAGVGKDSAPAVFRALDKLAKQGEALVRMEMAKAGLSKKQIDGVMNIITVSGKPAEVLPKAGKLLSGSKDAVEGLNELKEITELSKSYGTSGSIVIDLSLVRGLDYYTGPIYEISARSKASVGSISGGGRYDKLIELYGGSPTPATGGSLGVERICEVMAQEGMFKDLPVTKTKVLVVPAIDKSDVAKSVLETARKLRSAGIPTETDLMGRKLKALFEYAEKAGIPYMVIIGEKELESGKLTLKDLAKREQSELAIDAIIKSIE